MSLLYVIIGIVLAYLIGSLCSAIIIAKLCNLPNPAEEGSQNPGATNILRLAGPRYAAMVLVLDMLKGTCPVAISMALGLHGFALGCIALAAVLGHVYPIFFQFKGGKGVATALGTAFGVHLVLGCIILSIWIMIALITRWSSLSSLLSIALLPLCLLFTSEQHACLPYVAIAFIILYQHRSNIQRLRQGNEPKISFKKKLKATSDEH